MVTSMEFQFLSAEEHFRQVSGWKRMRRYELCWAESPASDPNSSDFSIRPAPLEDEDHHRISEHTVTNIPYLDTCCYGKTPVLLCSALLCSLESERILSHPVYG
jgi:hypothetical protein